MALGKENMDNYFRHSCTPEFWAPGVEHVTFLSKMTSVQVTGKLIQCNIYTQTHTHTQMNASLTEQQY